MNLARYRAAGAAGILAGLFIPLLMASSGGLMRWDALGTFYDAQARSWLDGSWEISVDVLKVEAFYHFDEAALAYLESPERLLADPSETEEFFRAQPSYMYQGPFPALLRLPIMALSGSLDGRLTSLSVLAAAAVAGLSVIALSESVRLLLHGEAPLRRGELAVAAALPFLAVGASSFVFLASQPIVYHEAIAWGVACGTGAIWSLLAYLRTPSSLRLVVLTALTTATMLSRVSIGLGPLLGIAVAGCAHAAAVLAGSRSGRLGALARKLGWAAPRGARGLAAFWGLAASGGVALGASAIVNHVKFGNWFHVPFESQYYTLLHPGRQEFLDVNGGFFGLQFVPTNLLQYLRPDAVRFSGRFPFIEFPPAPGTIVGDVMFDLFDRASSLPASHSVFVILAAVGCHATFRSSRHSRPLGLLRLPLLAALASALTILPFGFVAHRYLADALPFLLLATVVGSHWLLDAWPDLRARLRPLLAGVLVVAAVLTIWANASFGLLYQRLYGAPIDESYLAGFLGLQLDIAEQSPWGVEMPVRRGDALPSSGAPGELFVLGDCDALYFHDGSPANVARSLPWRPVERSRAAGHYELRATLGAGAPGLTIVLARSSESDRPAELRLEYLDGSRVRLGFAGSGLPRQGAEIEYSEHREYRMRIDADPGLGSLTVRLDDVTVLETIYTGPAELAVVGIDGALASGRAAGAASFAAAQEPEMALCSRLMPLAVPDPVRERRGTDS